MGEQGDDDTAGLVEIGPGNFIVQTLSEDDPLASIFTQEITTFGMRIVGTDTVASETLRHAAQVAAEYLDNDENGVADDEEIPHSLRRRRALLVMFANAQERDTVGVFERMSVEGFHVQDLYADETNVPGRFDATLEEVLHLIHTAGYAQVYPMAFGPNPGTRLTAAMDIARGGRFESVPPEYPQEAWYHYDDETCSYECMAVEYLYWGLTTILGAHTDAGRCAEIRREWEVCTSEALMMRDRALYALLTDGQYVLPTTLPDGQYTGRVIRRDEMADGP